MKKLALLLLLLTGLTGVQAGIIRTITGTVTGNDDGLPLPGVTVMITGTKMGTQTDMAGHYSLRLTEKQNTLTFTFIGYTTQIVTVKNKSVVDVKLTADSRALNDVVVTGYATQKKMSMTGSVSVVQNSAPMPAQELRGRLAGVSISKKELKVSKMMMRQSYAVQNDESYKGFAENTFQNPKDNPLSTFSVDVDAASYSNVRRFINNGQLPPVDAVRIEEMINYFGYNLTPPTDNEPVAIHTELSAAPWNPQHRLLRIGLKARTMHTDKLPPANLVFLIDVSGSMNEANKLPLVQSSLKMLVDQLRPQDKVALVVYAGNAGLVLPPTPGDQKNVIKDAIDRLSAGGSTAGGEGIKLAYNVAKENFIKKGTNRVILATDGDFNVGASSDDDMEHLIEQERKSGVFLSVLGFGMGNYKDSKMETLADKGNGNYAYVDNITEARKTLVSEFGSTLFTVAKDVKMQIEFNPALVQAYRLVGYENRVLAKEDFNNDTKDAGDMGAGHTVTAFYEIIPAGVHDSYTLSVDPLKYQKVEKNTTSYISSEMMTIKFRYKEPSSSKSKLSQVTVQDNPVDFNKTSSDFRLPPPLPR